MYVDIHELKPINFTPKDFQKARDALNSGKKVAVSTLVKMLHQAQYQQIEYQSLVTSLIYKRDDMNNTINSHANLAYPKLKGKK